MCMAKAQRRLITALGYASAFTLLQAVLLYILLSISLFHTGINVFKAYRALFESLLFPLDRLYFLFVNLMYPIFGLSYLYVIGFNNVFKLTLFTIFLCNLGLFIIWQRR